MRFFGFCYQSRKIVYEMNITHANFSAQDAFEFALQNFYCQLVGNFFFLVILICGTYLLMTVMDYARDNQYATLVDYLINISFTILMYTNFSGFSLWILRSVIGPLPVHACQVFTISDSVSWFILTMIVNQTLLIKLLYVTRWRSVGQINDDIFFEFFKAVNVTFAILHVAGQVHCNEFIQEVMTFCTGDVHTHYQEGRQHFNNYFGMISIGFWIFAMAKIWHQERTVNEANGLTTFQGFQFFFGALAFFASVGLSRIPNVLAEKYLSEGTLNQLPQALSVPIGTTLTRLVLAVITPLIMMCKKPPLRESLAKRLRMLNCKRTARIVPIV